ncbi:hypothetical protein [Streptomyces sp. NBC_00878]|uniref:hypothetical protein n=1 Tax=Streptomyces sp. NBC_00878 TaxID=2975854 RepID=UPI002253568F|nr:hypothetical protein [Streptomyces sp. NBC_00878]MCX4904443.1 hypothetical protein [Streptomyces sp. NBC_00878]
MPQRNPVTDPERVQFIWFGEEMSDNAKAGMKALSERFPNSARELWVMPRSRPGQPARTTELMDGYRREAEGLGVDVKNIREHTTRLAGALGDKYNAQTINDIFNMEMGNHGNIAAKDLATYLLRGTETGLSMDLSHHRMNPTEWVGVRGHDEFSHDRVAPFDFSTAELKVVDLSHGEDAISRNILNAGPFPMTEQHGTAEIDPQRMPHLDVFAMYTREGTKGQEVAKTAAQQHIGYLAQISQDEVRKGNVVFHPNDNDKRFRPVKINLSDDNLLAAKYNPQDPTRAYVIGHMAIGALADGIHLHYGKPTTPPLKAQPDQPPQKDMPALQVDSDTWKKITMQAYEVGNVRVLPQLSVGKVNQGAWRTEPTGSENITLVQASNLGVSTAAGISHPGGLNKPAPIPYEVVHSKSADNSPRRTPSPGSSSDESIGRTAREVASLNMPRTPSPESPGLVAAAAQKPARPGVQRSATGGPSGR